MFLKDVSISPFCLCGLMHIVFAQFSFPTEILKMHLCLYGKVYPLKYGSSCCSMVLADSLIMSSSDVLSHLKKWSFFFCLLLFTLMHEYYCIVCFWPQFPALSYGCLSHRSKWWQFSQTWAVFLPSTLIMNLFQSQLDVSFLKFLSRSTYSLYHIVLKYLVFCTYSWFLYLGFSLIFVIVCIFVKQGLHSFSRFSYNFITRSWCSQNMRLKYVYVHVLSVVKGNS